MKIRKKSISHEEHLKNTLGKNPQEAVEYLNLALQENDNAAFLMALQDVAKAFGGLRELAKKTGLNREGLYDTLSTSGNPAFNNLTSILDALGLGLSVKLKKTKSKKYALTA